MDQEDHPLAKHVRGCPGKLGFHNPKKFMRAIGESYAYLLLKSPPQANFDVIFFLVSLAMICSVSPVGGVTSSEHRFSRKRLDKENPADGGGTAAVAASSWTFPSWQV